MSSRNGTHRVAEISDLLKTTPTIMSTSDDGLSVEWRAFNDKKWENVLVLDFNNIGEIQGAYLTMDIRTVEATGFGSELEAR